MTGTEVEGGEGGGEVAESGREGCEGGAPIQAERSELSEVSNAIRE